MVPKDEGGKREHFHKGERALLKMHYSSPKSIGSS